MGQELEEELHEGKDAAIRLVEHVQRMGAAEFTIPVVVNGEVWDVTARRSEVNDLEAKG